MPDSVASPFLRWAGGKRGLFELIAAASPKRFGRYFEPFVGGGAVLLGIPARRCVANDVNPWLVTTYAVVRDNVEALIERLRELARDTSRDGYLAARELVPTDLDPVQRAALFIYLNKLCFNGLYRENASGHFNVPYGHIARPNVCDEAKLRAASRRLQGVELRCGSFADAVADAGPGDLVYLDPPYIPLSPSSSFSRYARHDFREPDQRELGALVATLIDRGAHVMLSNSDTPLTRAIYAGLGGEWALYGLQVRRSISAASSSRGRVGEVLGLSYPLSACAAPDVVCARLGLVRGA